MKLQQLKDNENFELVLDSDSTDEIIDAYTSDLLSDVMGNAPEEAILITIQAHKNTIAVSSLTNTAAIILCNNRIAPSDMIDAAKEESIAIFSTSLNQFQASCEVGKLLQK
jgi:serine kinase of HPr protein (carbohydrate metabolism regulator)